MITDTASSLNYVEFDEVKGCSNTHDMWTKLKDIYAGDDNVKRDKEKILRGQFDQMNMKEDENITKYVERIKASVSAIKAFGGEIDDKKIVRKVLKKILPIYAIQELRCVPNNKIRLDALVGGLTTFELDNYDNYVPNSKNFAFAFEGKISLKKKSPR